MRKITVGAIIAAAAFGIFALSKDGECKIQFLQKGVPVAGADVSVLILNGPEPRHITTTTTTDGSLCLPGKYRGAWISLKVTKQESVIADFVIGDIPEGIRTIDFVANNRTRVTEKKGWLGLFASTTTAEWTDRTRTGEPSAADGLRGAEKGSPHGTP